MKKSLIAVLMIVIFCFAGVASAATNSFSDVPTSHWAYSAVTKLAKAGIIDGYSNGTFEGNKTITRYEMAQIVANAMTKADKADPEQKALINKLSKEFADELQALGVRVANLENNANNFHYFGIFGNRFDHMKQSGVTDRSAVIVFDTFFKINDNFTLVTQNELHRMYSPTAEQWNNNGNGKTPNGSADWQHFGLQAYADGKFDGLSTKLGRFTYIPAYGITHGDYLEVSGAQVTFGNKIKTTLVAGQDTNYVPQGTYASMNYKAADVVAAVSPVTNVRLSYQRNQSGIGLAPAVAYSGDDNYYNYFEGGFDTKLGKNLSFEAAYIKSSYDDANKGYYAQLKYKNAIPFVANTYDVYVAYHNLESSSIMYNDLRYYPDMKGVRVGFHYTPWNSTLLTVWYDIQKYIDTTTTGLEPSGGTAYAGEKDNFFRAQFDFFFK
ncbi:MAG: S-layer protein [Firmicutes bacterium]|nr:S-layer protein [Bacillota bacterium]